ncbi:MAG: RDD family protein [Pirellulales bacterium]
MAASSPSTDARRLDAPSIDGQVDVVTPENVAFHYEVAGPFRRLPAYLIDLALRVLIALVMLLVLWAVSSTGIVQFGFGFLAIGFFVLTHFYGGLFETFWNGQTPGKRLIGLRVLTVDGRPINALQAVLRNILRDVDTMPYAFGFILPEMQLIGLYWVGLISMALTDRYQRLGDLAAGTMVVVERRAWSHGVVQITDSAALALSAEIPVDFEVTRSLGKALSMYAERRLTLSPLRRAEVARHLAVPLAARLRMPSATNYDTLLCALYHRTFVATDPGQDTAEPKVFEDLNSPITQAPLIQV